MLGIIEQLKQWLDQFKQQNVTRCSLAKRPRYANGAATRTQVVKPEQKQKIEAPPLSQTKQGQAKQHSRSESLKVKELFHQSTKQTLQEKLDLLQDGTTLQLWPRDGEYQGPVVINRPLTIEGQGATIWALTGPVLSINSGGVKLRNLRVEVTGEPRGEPQQQCAILVKSGQNLQLNDVEVRGLVMGLPEEEGGWNYPKSLHLGKLAYGKEQDLLLRMIVPVECRIASSIHGLRFEPHRLNPGRNEIRLHIDRLPEDTLINGTIFLATSSLKRRITLTAHILSLPDEEFVNSEDRVVWEPEEWENYVPVQELDDSFANTESTEPVVVEQPKPTEVIVPPSDPETLEESSPGQSDSSVKYKHKLSPGEKPNRKLFKSELSKSKVDQEDSDNLNSPQISDLFKPQQSQASAVESPRKSDREHQIGKEIGKEIGKAFSIPNQQQNPKSPVDTEENLSQTSSQKSSQLPALFANQESKVEKHNNVSTSSTNQQSQPINPIFKESSVPNQSSEQLDQNSSSPDSPESTPRKIVRSKEISPLFGNSSQDKQ
ncbi:hypothetical protein BJP36_12595 [Moorena producens JHB]|uniref:Uncharacterized protein n=1 Tax=Moorena producens (strain JHB) TaxID=1454205 RepID=A0A1D9FZ43_MOOP1|nr:hypothetical protein [Moorena producens]AOY80637.2 hypothetical protein BJP36_12595 [Moorena producens JHB]